VNYVIGTKNVAQPADGQAQFDAAGERIYYVEDVGRCRPQSSETVLLSVKPDGTDKRTHLRFTRSEEAASPRRPLGGFMSSTRWVTALHRSARRPSTSISRPALPLAQFTDRAGGVGQLGDGGKTMPGSGGDLSPDRPRQGLARGGSERCQGSEGREGRKGRRTRRKKLPKTRRSRSRCRCRATTPWDVAYTGGRVVTMKGTRFWSTGRSS